MQNGITFTVFNNITLCFIWFIDFNWAINDFKQMKSYLKRKLSYGEAKSQNTLDNFNHYQSNLRFNLDCVTYHHRNHMVESTNRFFCMHYTAGLLSVVFQLAHVVEETTNPSPNELGNG
jgi:linoleoyl-CoA desaturase